MQDTHPPFWSMSLNNLLFFLSLPLSTLEKNVFSITLVLVVGFVGYNEVISDLKFFPPESDIFSTKPFNKVRKGVKHLIYFPNFGHDCAVSNFVHLLPFQAEYHSLNALK